jgi:purine-binding chemotaxis protein CheW
VDQLVDTAAPEQHPDAGYPTGVVVRYGTARYAVPMAAVAEVVVVPPAVTRVPGAPAWLTGVVNWRGHVLPLVDPRSLLGAERTPLPSSARVLVLAVDGVEVGVLVEAVAGLLDAGDDTPETAPVTATASAASLVTGVVADGAGPLSLLDPAALTGLRAQLPAARR